MIKNSRRRLSVYLVLNILLVVVGFMIYQSFVEQTEGDLKPITGKVQDVRDLFVQKNGSQSGYYRHIRQITLQDEIFYIPLVGLPHSSPILQLRAEQKVKLQVDVNRTVQHLEILP